MRTEPGNIGIDIDNGYGRCDHSHPSLSLLTAGIGILRMVFPPPSSPYLKEPDVLTLCTESS